MKNVLGGLAAAITLSLAPHALAETATVSVTYELHAFTDVDGVRKVDTNLTTKPFYTLEACIDFAKKLDSPPAAREYFGHTIVYGYVCQKVEVQGMVTQK